MLTPCGSLLGLGRRTSVRPRGEEGTAAVEFAMVMPVLLLMLFGIVDFGRAIQQQIQLTEGVREAARVGALNGTATDMQTQVSNSVGTGVPLTFSAVQVCTNSSATGADATITVKRTFEAVTPLFALMQSFNASSPSGLTITATGAMGCTG